MPTNGVSRSLSKSVRLPAELPPVPRNNPQLHSPPRSRAVSSAEPPSAKVVNPQSILRKPSLSAGIVAPSAFKEPSPSPAPRGAPKGVEIGESGFPKRNRHVQRSSLDLDELSDEGPPIRRKPSVLAPKGHGSSSAATRELIDFLSEGPPEISSPDSAKPKPGGRLRSMVSRLARGSTERLKDASPTKPMPPSVRPSASASLNAVKNRSTYTPPPAPYYPRPSSPHSNSSSSNDLDAPEATSSHRKGGQTVQWESARALPVSTPTSPASPVPTSVRVTSHREATIIKGLPSPSPEVDKTESGALRSPPSKSPQPTHPIPLKVVTSSLSVPKLQASDLRDSVLKATSPHECRLLVDMFLARCGFELPADILQAVTAAPMTREETEAAETSLVDVLLGEGPSFGFAAFEQQVEKNPVVVEATA